jgi:hypothetical protein
MGNFSLYLFRMVMRRRWLADRLQENILSVSPLCELTEHRLPTCDINTVTLIQQRLIAVLFRLSRALDSSVGTLFQKMTQRFDDSIPRK